MKFIRDGSRLIFPPGSANADTSWSEVSNTDPQVEIRMSQACGGSTYAGQIVFDDGWVRRTLQHTTELIPIPGTTSVLAQIEPFDENSLANTFTK